jgi:hypothetical protein
MVELDHHIIEAHHLGPNASSRFWCGFCTATVDLTGPRADAWPERWHHLEAHFTPDAGGNAAAYLHYITSE